VDAGKFVDALEAAVLVAVFLDASRHRFADAGQLQQFRPPRLVEIDPARQLGRPAAAAQRAKDLNQQQRQGHAEQEGHRQLRRRRPCRRKGRRGRRFVRTRR
jgi:hypothetical protein